MERKVLNNASAVGIIYLSLDSSYVFLEIKDDGYPRKVFVRKGCLIGGNWAGEAARNDRSPRDTFVREIAEELSFERAVIDPVEIRQLHGIDAWDVNAIPKGPIPCQSDIDKLDALKMVISKNVEPYRTYIQNIPQRVFRRGEPEYSRGDYYGLLSCFKVALVPEEWKVLIELQQKFGNLSNESITIITSLQELMETSLQISWGHDQVLQQFFRDCGFSKAKLNIIPDIGMTYSGKPQSSYRPYLEKFEFLITPFVGTK